MKKLLKITIWLQASLICMEASAQQDATVSHYMFNGMFLNPAYAGVRNSPNITAVYRKQWVNFSGSPETELLSFDQKFNDQMGLGLMFGNDNIGVSGQTDIYACYSYRLRLDTRHLLALGLRGGISNYRAALQDLTVWDADDNVYSLDIAGKWVPNFGSGAYFYSEKYYAGISVPRILNYNPSTFLHVEIDRAPQYERHYYLNGGYIIKINEDVSLKPSFLVKYVGDVPVQGDINANVYYKKMVGIGASYRTKDGLIALLELNTKQHIRIGYAFDYSFNKLGKYSVGTHEIMLAYDFEKGISMPKFSKSGK